MRRLEAVWLWMQKHWLIRLVKHIKLIGLLGVIKHPHKAELEIGPLLLLLVLKLTLMFPLGRIGRVPL
jgi:hypothetical protein